MPTDTRVRATCPSCGNGVRADRARLSSPVKCPKCGETALWTIEEPPAPKPKLAPLMPRKTIAKPMPKPLAPAKTSTGSTPESASPEQRDSDPLDGKTECAKCGCVSNGVKVKKCGIRIFIACIFAALLALSMYKFSDYTGDFRDNKLYQEMVQQQRDFFGKMDPYGESPLAREMLLNNLSEMRSDWAAKRDRALAAYEVIYWFFVSLLFVSLLSIYIKKAVLSCPACKTPFPRSRR